MISYFSTNLDGTAGVWKRGQWLVPRTTEAARGASGQLRIRAAPSAARAARRHLRPLSSGLQLGVNRVRPILLLLQLVRPILRLLLLVRLYQLLLLLMVQVRLVLLPLLVLQPVVFQLKQQG